MHENYDRPEPSRPDAARPEARIAGVAISRILGMPIADLPKYYLSTGTEGEVCPQHDLCTRATLLGFYTSV